MSDTQTLIVPDGIEPFSLYLDLESGKLADLESIARISLALSAALREAAFVIDPSISIKIEILSGTECSFSLNTFIKSIKPKDILTRKNLKALAWACFIWFGSESAEYTYEKVLDHFLDSPQAVELSDADKQDIANRVATILQKNIAHEQVTNVYRTLQSDHAIKGVGASQTHGKKPSYIVPRGEFQHRSGTSQESQLPTTTRVRPVETTVTLISPVLLEDSPRRWRVRGTEGEGEFGASVKDEAFLKSLTHGQVRVQMVSDIRLVVKMEIKDSLENGVWVIKERNITKVLKIISPSPPPSLTIDGKPL